MRVFTREGIFFTPTNFVVRKTKVNKGTPRQFLGLRRNELTQRNHLGGRGSGGKRVPGLGKTLGRPRLPDGSRRLPLNDRVSPLTLRQINRLSRSAAKRRGIILDQVLARSIANKSYRGLCLRKPDIVAAAEVVRVFSGMEIADARNRRVALNISVAARLKSSLIAFARDRQISRGRVIDAVVAAVESGGRASMLKRAEISGYPCLMAVAGDDGEPFPYAGAPVQATSLLLAFPIKLEPR